MDSATGIIHSTPYLVECSKTGLAMEPSIASPKSYVVNFRKVHRQ